MNAERASRPETAYVRYVFTWALLLALLILTIAIAKLSLLASYSVIGSLFIATVKAGLVLMYFMHLGHEGRIVKGMLLLAVAALFFIIALTFSDVWFR
ncbi:MAG TPA: cytochrome C oxidase subunit IV family protein [Dissulfurispiraceae bacterium]|nr:cytochrome C oxidase subunit IV family protein [Dissulfurispiraceae bacterium]